MTEAASGREAYFGLLHAHTMFSDGSGTPLEAFSMARSEGLDFLAVTPHNHASAERGIRKKSHGPRKDGVMIAVTPELYSSSDLVSVTRNFKDGNGAQQRQSLNVRPLVQAAAQRTDDDFVALYGQEFSTISNGNHVNVFGIDSLITVPKGEHGQLYALLEGLPAPLVVQMNHPNFAKDLFHPSTEPNDRDDDYGLDDFGHSFAALTAGADKFLMLIEVISGPATTMDVFNRQPRRNEHERDYYFYLSQGLHVSPSAGQDNHWKDWGKKTPSRTGVIAEELTESALLQAMCRRSLRSVEI
ncbi:MAG: hypothetical protein GY937_04305 [bacterium]|nr:hypothetical protein [bacterium]